MPPRAPATASGFGEELDDRPYRKELQPLYDEARELKDKFDEGNLRATKSKSTSTESHRSKDKGRKRPLNEYEKAKARFVKKAGKCNKCKVAKTGCDLIRHFAPEYEETYQANLRQKRQQREQQPAFSAVPPGFRPESIGTSTQGHQYPPRPRTEPSGRRNPAAHTNPSSSSTTHGLAPSRSLSSQHRAAPDGNIIPNISQQLLGTGSQFSNLQPDATPGHDPLASPRSLAPYEWPIWGMDSFHPASNRVHQDTLVLGRTRYSDRDGTWQCLFGNFSAPMVDSRTLFACRRRFRNYTELWHHFQRDHNQTVPTGAPEGYQFSHVCTRCLVRVDLPTFQCPCMDPTFRETRLYPDVITQRSSQPALPLSRRVGMDSVVVRENSFPFFYPYLGFQ